MAWSKYDVSVEQAFTVLDREQPGTRCGQDTLITLYLPTYTTQTVTVTSSLSMTSRTYKGYANHATI